MFSWVSRNDYVSRSIVAHKVKLLRVPRKMFCYTSNTIVFYSWGFHVAIHEVNHCQDTIGFCHRARRQVFVLIQWKYDVQGLCTLMICVVLVWKLRLHILCILCTDRINLYDHEDEINDGNSIWNVPHAIETATPKLVTCVWVTP